MKKKNYMFRLFAILLATTLLLSNPIQSLVVYASTGEESDEVDFTTLATSDREGLSPLSNLTDGTADTFSGDLKYDKGFTLDFGTGGRVSLTQVDLQARSGFGNRMVGGTVKGSLDGNTFIELTTSQAVNSTEMQNLIIKDEYKNTLWRYIRIEGVGASNIFSVGEMVFHGANTVLEDSIANISVYSSNTDSMKATTGDIITVDITAIKAIKDVVVTLKNIGTMNTATSSLDVTIPATGEGLNWSATYTVSQYDFAAPISLEISAKDESTGLEVVTKSGSTDGTSVDIIADNFIDITDSTLGVDFGLNVYQNSDYVADYTTGDADTQISYITDKNYSTNSEQRPNNNSWQGAIYLDFGASKAIYLSSVQILARSGFPARMSGAYVQASNDGVEWTTITDIAGNSIEWQILNSLDKKIKYRYLKIYGGQYCNIAEIKFFGRIRDDSEKYLYGLMDAVDEGNEILTLGQQNYSEESWNSFIEAWNTAITVHDSNESYTQQQIDDATTNLLTAITELAEPLPWFVDTEGTALNHPAIGISGERLEEVRNHILNKEQPWYDYYLAFRQSTFALKTYVSRNDGSPETDDLVANFGFKDYNTNLFNNQMTQDAKAAYYQALMYYFTGDVQYRANSIRILRLWSQLNPAECTYASDAHIHMGIPVTLFNSAAELIRYTSTFETEMKYIWTQEDSTRWYTNFLEQPLIQWLDKNRYWLNQQQFSNMAAMSSYIFNDDKANYEKLVERTMVNSGLETEDEIYQNGAIANAFCSFTEDYKGNKLDQTYYAVKEMSRDQSHAYDNIENAGILAQMMNAQGTKVDPSKGTVSTAENAVGAYEFMDRCILKGTNTFCGFALGYAINFSDGRLGYGPSDAYRGRLNNVSQVYYYYKYAMGYTGNEDDFKYLNQYFASYESVSGVPIDETWIYLPEEATGSTMPNTVSNRADGTHHIEYEYTDLSDNMITETTEGDQTYLSVQASEEGTPFVLYGGGSWGTRIDFYLSTSESTTIARYDETTGEILESYYVPDTGGEWRYCSYSFGSGNEMLFLKLIGQSIVNIDSYKVNDATITPPTFTAGIEQVGYGYCGQKYSTTIVTTDSNVEHTIHYSLVGAPADMEITDTGLLSWKIPEEQKVGVVKFYVLATDGVSISTLVVNILIKGSFEDTILTIIEPFDKNAVYETASRKAYQQALTAAEELVEEGSDEERIQAIENLQIAVDELKLLNPLLSDGGIDLGETVKAVDNLSMDNMSILSDMNLSSGTGILWGNTQKSFTMDFGVDFQINISSVIMATADDWSARGDGMQIFGSNDKVNWYPLLESVSEDKEGYQTLQVREEQKTKKYRFIKVIDLNGGVLNRDQTTEDQPFTISELHLIGERTETVNEIVNVNISSDEIYDKAGVLYSYAGIGNTVKLTFETKEELAQTDITIAGETVQAVKALDSNIYTASLYIDHVIKEDAYPFTIDYICQDGRKGNTVYFVTDSSKLLINGQADVISDIMKNSSVTTSAGVYTTDQVGVLFDKDLTNTEFRMNNTGWGSWLMFDLGEDNKAKLSRVDILARSGFAGRLSGTYIQGSNDNVTWYDLTAAAYGIDEWQQLTVNEEEKTQAYRYIRIMNGANWFGNIAEIRFYGEAGTNVVSEEKTTQTYSVTTKASVEKGGTTIAYVNETESNDPQEPEDSYTETELTGLAKGTSVTVIAKPAEGYRFVEWISEEVIMGENVEDYLWSTYPKFTIINYGGGYLGKPLSFGVNKDWKLTAVFEKISDSEHTGDTSETDTSEDGSDKEQTSKEEYNNSTEKDKNSESNNEGTENVEILAEDTKTLTIKPTDIEAALADPTITLITVKVKKKKEDCKVILSKETQAVIASKNKDLRITIEGVDGTKDTWFFYEKELRNIIEYDDILLNVKKTSVEQEKQTNKVLEKIIKNNKMDGLYVDLEQKENLGITGRVGISLKTLEGAIKGKKLYIYHINKNTGKLETIVGGYSCTVCSDYSVVFPVLSGGEYVIFTEKADSKIIVSLKNQIRIDTDNKTIKKGESTAIVVELPACLQQVSSLKNNTESDAIGAVTISYKSSDKSIATVNKDGKITGRKKGRVMITATVKLYNGSQKTIKLTLKIK